MDEFIRRLADIGVAEAESRGARGAADGNSDFRVDKFPIQNGYRIVASGHDVCFLEFGTGYAAGLYYEGDLSKVSVPVYPGSYSEQNTNEFATYGSWHYQKQKYTQTDAEMPMYNAVKVMRENAKRLAEEVFGK